MGETAVALAGLAVAALGIVGGPVVSSRMAQREALHTRRLEIYAKTIQFMRLRHRELHQASLGIQEQPEQFLPEAESDAVISEMLLVANKNTWAALEEFMRLYWAPGWIAIEPAARALPDGRVKLGQAADKLRLQMDDVVNEMRKHVGVKNMPLSTTPSQPG